VGLAAPVLPGPSVAEVPALAFPFSQSSLTYTLKKYFEESVMNVNWKCSGHNRQSLRNIGVLNSLAFFKAPIHSTK
jgi:hypothetical protein